MPELNGQKKTYMAIAAGVITAVASAWIISFGEAYSAHATTDDLADAKTECMQVAQQLKIDQEKADLELQKADTELKQAQKALNDTMVEHIRVDTADTREIMTTLGHIKEDIKRIADKQEEHQ